jgi:mannose-1-phosphate guanylyltransferase/mannose-6-phosphate isomerase
MGRVALVTNENHRFLVAEIIRKTSLNADILIEPTGRNTAPAIGLAALHALEEDSESVLLVLPSDHIVKDRSKFQSAIAIALPAVRAGALATFGVVPTAAETGYGYIRRGEAEGELFKVAEFREKPDLATAESYLESGEYYWNSGMFLFRADRYLEELQKHAPDIRASVEHAMHDAAQDLDFIRPEREAFEACRSESVDYAVMEKTDRAVVVPLDAGWSDIGSWVSFAEMSETDDHGNVLEGDVLAFDTENSLLYSQGRLLAALGVKDHIVVETADAVLVAAKDRVQDVKKIVAKLKEQGRREAVEHKRVYRPWGYYESIMEGPFFQVKKLCVKPTAKLSMQMHYHRAEHWVVVAGTARVTNGEGEFLLAENESTYISKGHRHRLENPGKITLEVIEIQTGAYLGEDDILRFDDTYGRIGE